MPKKTFSKEAILIFAALKKYFSLPLTSISYTTGINSKNTRSAINELVKNGYLCAEKYGAHCYYRENIPLTSALDPTLICEATSQLKNLPSLEKNEPIRAARTCYGHMAGILGVKLREKLVADGLIEEKNSDYRLTNRGKKRFADFGLEDFTISKKRALNIDYVKPCLDWTERRYHLGGDFGKTLTQYLFKLNWLEYFPGSRALKINEKGRKGILKEFGLDMSSDDSDNNEQPHKKNEQKSIHKR